MEQNAAKTSYFDLHTKGVGYLNRIREVRPKKGEPFWACSISALRGEAGSVEYTNFDCRISGAEAQKQIRRCMKAVEGKKKVLVCFTIGDIYPQTFVFDKGSKKGETGVQLKGRLLFVSFIKIDGNEVYTAPKKDEAKAEGSVNEPEATA